MFGLDIKNWEKNIHTTNIQRKTLKFQHFDQIQSLQCTINLYMYMSDGVTVEHLQYMSYTCNYEAVHTFKHKCRTQKCAYLFELSKKARTNTYKHKTTS